MKLHLISALLSAAVILNMSAASAYCSDTTAVYDNADGITDCFDLVKMRSQYNKQYNNSDLNTLSGFVLNRIPYDFLRSFDKSAILEPMNTVHNGDGTFYGGGYEGGCAMLDPISKKDYWIVAMNLADYNNAQLAGAYLEVTGELGTIKMLVTDLLPEGKKGDLDLYTDAFPLIAPFEKGRVPVSWKIIPLDSAENAPVSFKFKEGSSPFWCGVQVRNHRYPVTKLEYLDNNGKFIELQRRNYNFFESRFMGAGPFTFRITDIYGHVIIDENIPLVPDKISQGHIQFPL